MRLGVMNILSESIVGVLEHLKKSRTDRVLQKSIIGNLHQWHME